MRFLVNNRNTVHGIPNGILYHRIHKPLQFLGVEYDFFWDISEIPNKDYDFMLFNRSLGWKDENKETEFILECKNAGIKVIMDIDDYWELPEYHTIRWRPDVNYEEWRGGILKNLALADYIWTSTDFLKAKIQEVHPNTPIVTAKNAIDYDEAQWSSSVPKKHPNKVNVGWVGSLTHYKDLNQLRRPVIAINKILGNKVQFHLTGMNTNNNWAGDVAKEFHNIFTNNGKRNRDNVTYWQPVPTNKYGLLYDQFDISIAPLVDNDFNKAKSELKVIEAGAKYLPFIGSDVLTYRRTEANIDLCSDAKEWTNSLKDLISSKELRIELGQELGEYVRDVYTFEKANRARLSLLYQTA